MSQWNSQRVRETFIQFFESKGHHAVASAPVVVKNDPTLMFTNAGMNQFKDIFLGNSDAKYKRVANSQKCLRVSGKHNDLEEVGVDTYHHTLFEMLGNWSFGDYFKKEAIDWAWELITEVYQLDKDRLYATIFQGDEQEGLGKDNEAQQLWGAYLDESRIIPCSKKDNFWEMGDVGPCGPCTELHIDLRSDEDRLKVAGRDLVNKDHPQVIEIWNLVFIEFYRNAEGALSKLPSQHVDTGMGLERLCMALQHKQSNYDTDLFIPVIQELEQISGLKYTYTDSKKDVAFRVIADHLRAIGFTIADGQIPSNSGAGYVIRRILRRAVRYGFSFLNLKQPFIYQLLPVLNRIFNGVYPEIEQQLDLIRNVIQEEEKSFLRTLANGINRIEAYVSEHGKVEVPGEVAFELYDTYGFPIDLTALILQEQQIGLDKAGFDRELNKQKERSRAATTQKVGDWVELLPHQEVQFIGYDSLITETQIIKYRTVQLKGAEVYQAVLSVTPFYPEGGGQVGDTGIISSVHERINVIDTRKENDLIYGILERLPEKPEALFIAEVNKEARHAAQRNHSATHLLHHVLRKRLGEHVQQKGSLVNAEYLRFDFSHFAKVEEEELRAIELEVNALILENAPLEEFRSIALQEALQMNAMALFGEKYGENVRAIKFGQSVELCGGTHVNSTGAIGLFKISSEGSVAAGIRRIEAITGNAVISQLNDYERQIESAISKLKAGKDLNRALDQILDKVAVLEQENYIYKTSQLKQLKTQLLAEASMVGEVKTIFYKTDLPAGELKDLVFQIKEENENVVCLVASVAGDKITYQFGVSLDLQERIKANELVKLIAPLIQGGGGGQPGYASAGGKKVDSLDEVRAFVIKKLKR